METQNLDENMGAGDYIRLKAKMNGQSVIIAPGNEFSYKEYCENLEKTAREEAAFNKGLAKIRADKITAEAEQKRQRKSEGAKKAAATRKARKAEKQKQLAILPLLEAPAKIITEQIKIHSELEVYISEVKKEERQNVLKTYLRCPAGSILDTIVRTFATKTDTPANIALWITFATLGGYLVQKNKMIEFGRQIVGTNIWFIVLAESGIGKSTLIDNIRDILSLNESGKIEFNQAGYRSKAAIVDDMAKSQTVKKSIYIIDEVAQLIKLFHSNSDSGQSLKEAFLAAYSGHIEHTTKADGKIEIKDIFLTVISATVLSTFQDSVKPEDLADGFLQRFLIIIANENERNMSAWPYLLDKSDEENINNVFTEYAAKINKIEKFIIEPDGEAFKYWQNWYFNHFNKDIESYYKRYLWSSLKIAAVYNSLIEADGIISKTDMIWAIRLLNDALESLYEVMDKYLAFNDWERLIQKVRIYYEKHPEISDRDVMRNMHISKKVLEIVKNNLNDRGYKELKAITQ